LKVASVERTCECAYGASGGDDVETINVELLSPGSYIVSV
jgi:hypothetical protein